MKKNHLLCLVFVLFFSTVNAQNSVWQGSGRIAISADGNEHDHDDWAATPLSLAMLAASGMQDHLVLYIYSDHVWGSNQNHPASESGLNAYEHMRESALNGGKYFGFDNTGFVCAVDNAEVAYNALRDEINRSTAENPLIIIAAGPVHVIGEAVSRAEKEKRRFVTVISHGRWNEYHADRPIKAWWDVHSGWTLQEMEDKFSTSEGGSLKCIKIPDQNGGDDYEGLRTDKFRYDWIKTSPARENYKQGSWDWLYTRLETCIKDNGKNFDPSDAGMVVYMLTGIEKTNPDMVREIMENPVRKK
jgi:hypothetical protein